MLHISRSLTFPTILLCAAALLLAQVADAAPPAPLTSTGVVTVFTVTATRAAGGNTFVSGNATIPATGMLDGVFVGISRQVIHADGTGNDSISYVFTGVTPCGTGSFSISGSGRLFDENDPTDFETGHFTSVDDKANTAGIHIDVDFTRVGPGLTFSGTHRCL